MRIKRVLLLMVLGATPVFATPTPTGLAGTATSAASIQWSWNPVSTATYNLYNIIGSSAIPVTVGQGTTSYMEAGFSPNTAYVHSVSAVLGGVESALSPGVTVYTLAAVPGVPFSNTVTSTTITLAWSAAGNSGSTIYSLFYSTDPVLSTGTVSTIPFSANLTAATTVLTNLNPSTFYYFRVEARNNAGINTMPTGIAAVQTQAPSGATGSGTGSASVAPASVLGGALTTSTITYTVPTGGMAAGGRLEVDLPANWFNALQTGCPSCNGYVSLISSAAATFGSLSVSTSGVVAPLGSGFIPAGTQIQFAFQNISVGCPFSGQAAATWQVRSALTTASVLQSLANLPSQTYSAGTAQSIGFNLNGNNTFTTVANQSSPPLVLQAYNNCGQSVSLSTSVVVNLSGFVPGAGGQYNADAGAQFSTSSSFSVSTTSIVFPALASAATFYYKTSTLGNLAIQGTYSSFVYTGTQNTWFYLNSIPTLPSFSNVSVDNGAQTSGQTSVTITPDGTGTNNSAYIRFLPSIAAQQWHVSISSNGFQTIVFDRWGNGDPQSTVVWNGQLQPTGGVAAGLSVAPNGTYAVKIDFGGLSPNTALSIAVNTSQISGTVKLGGTPVAGAIVSAQGPGIYNSVFTDASGNYVINGLHASYSYNLYATYTNPANQAVVTGQINNVTAPTAGENFNLSTPSVIRVAGVASNAAIATVYGNLNMHSADYSQNFFGNLRLQGGTTTTDNGDSFNPSTWTLFYVQPATSYVLQLTMPGYGAANVTVTGSSDVVLSLKQQANIYGVITLPAAAPYGVWASVSGIPTGTNNATVSGGTFFNVGQSTAIYSLYAVPPGNYTLETQITGFVPAVLTNVAVGTNDLGNAGSGGEDFPTIGVGGTISGTITINGDTSALPNPISFYLNAYSPTLGYDVSTQVQLTTSTTQTSASYQIGGVADGTYQMYPPYLQGFDPSTFGAQNVTVHGSASNVNFSLTQETGQINIQVKLPNGNSDYSNVTLTLQGPENFTQNLTGNTLTISHLGTGFFNLQAFYKTTGAQSQSTVNLTNGQSLTTVVDLSAPSYAVTGAVSIQSAFSMKGSSGTAVTINTISDLLANATNQSIYIGGTQAVGTNVGALNCSSIIPITTSTARVEAFPKSFNSFGNSNRSGLSNCFALGGYSFGAINSDGSFSVPNLSPGVWEIDVYPYFDGAQTPDAAAQTQFVTITGSPINSLNFSLSAGNSVSGAINLPTGLTDLRTFNVQILDTRGNTIQSTTLQLGAAGAPAASANYTFTNLPAGQYSLLVQDPGSYDSTLNQNVIKYVAAPLQFTINGADVTGLNVALSRSARIVGTLGIQTTNGSGTTSLTLITPNNKNLLPSGFQISAQSDPWIPGGYENAEFSTDGTNGPAIDANNHFTIDGLAAGTYDISFQQNSYGISVQAAGGLNLASYTQGSIIVTQGQTLDLGTIILKPGLSLSGTVIDTSGNALSNITIRATPSASQNGNNQLQVTTDAQGNFTLAGLSSVQKIYDIVAAPRPGSGDSTPPVPYGQVSRLAVDVTQVPAPTLNFTLSPATSLLSGKILTGDGGSLSFPDGDQAGYPEAAVYLHLEGSTSDDNPLGQENATALDGSFAIGDLVAGVYDMTVESLGYQPFRVTGIVLAVGATTNVPTITLQRGAELDATLARPDGSLVNTSQVNTVVAVSPDLTSIIFGQVNKDANTNNILSLKFSGFQLSPQTYNVLLFDNQNNITSPLEGRNLVFTSSGEITARALTYVQSPPFAFTDVKRAGAVGSAVSITYYFSRPLRSLGSDQDPSQWFTLVSGHGNLSGYQLSGDRTQLTVIYNPAAGEQNATIGFSAHTVDIDPSTGVEFLLNKTITLLLGQKATVENQINSALGGSLSLSQANDPSNVFIPGNALLTSSGTAADATISYNFTLTATDDISTLVNAALPTPAARGIAYSALIKYGAPAYVSEAYQAMSVASRDTNINPLSSFYSILLPAGISHTLNQTAYITLNYDSTADPTLINVYYFNGMQYYIQNTARTIDLVNHTITVGVSHFSTFVVLQNTTPVIVTGDTGDTDADINVFNFPNPFDFQSKTLDLTHSGTSILTNGTVIRYSVPAAKVGPATIRIYDVVGKKVRTIDLGTPGAGSYNYVVWDGTNDAGRRVASGVYIGVLDIGGEKKFWKMAVIK